MEKAPENSSVPCVAVMDGLTGVTLDDIAPPAPEPEPSVPDWLETTQFLTDVTTAAGLLAYGRRDKGLARRISEFAFKYQRLAAAPKPPVT